MCAKRKILSIMFMLAWLLSTGSLVLYGQNQVHKLHPKHPVTIGFQTGKSSFFSTQPGIKHTKHKYPSTNSLTVKAQLTKHLKAEAGLTLTSLQNHSSSANIQDNRLNFSKKQSLSLPLSLQYYPLPHRYKVQPFCGIGLQCNCHPFNPNITLGNEGTTANENVQSGTKYISIMFVQGVTYEINTRIQVTQSFHFLPETNGKTMGIGFGIGYTIP